MSDENDTGLYGFLFTLRLLGLFYLAIILTIAAVIVAVFGKS